MTSFSSISKKSLGSKLLAFLFLSFFTFLWANTAHAQVNLAFGKTVTASTGSTNLGSLTDGNFSTIATSGNTQTGNNAEWFLVDLGADYFIESATIGVNPTSTATQDRMRRFMFVSWPSTVAGPTGLGRNIITYIDATAANSLYNRLSYQAGNYNNSAYYTIDNNTVLNGPAFTNSRFSFATGVHKARYVMIMNMKRASFDPSEIQIFASQAPSVRTFTNGGFELETGSDPRGWFFPSEANAHGWSTTDAVGSDMAGQTPTGGGFLEVWPNGLNAIPSHSGARLGELNSYNNAMLEQRPICVLAGETFTWSFAHRGRTGQDVMALRIDGVDVGYFNDNNAQAGTHAGSLLPAGVGTTTINGNGAAVQTTAGTINRTAEANGWTVWSGTWTNTSGSSKQVTFGFRAVSSSSGTVQAGNMLDDVSLASLSALASLNTPLGTKNGIGPEFRATANLPKVRLQGQVTAVGSSIQLQITGGTATRGVDYTTKLNAADAATSTTGNITIPIPVGVYDGTDATAISLAPYIKILTDNVNPESDETIEGLLVNPVGLVVIGDAGACTTSNTAGAFSYTITDTPPITVAVTPTNVTCFGSGNGKATPTVAGGSGSYTYSWNTTPIQTTATAINLVPGDYTLTVTDAISGEVRTGTVTIGQPASALAATGVVTDATSSSSTTGAVDLTVTGGTTPYTYLWSNNATTEDITGLASGTYSVIVTDANGCSTNASFAVKSTVNANNVTATIKVNNESTGTVIPSLSATDGDGTIGSYQVTTLPPANQGTLFYNNGTTLVPVTTATVLTPTQAAGLTFVPDNNYVGPVNFKFTATDNDGLSDLTPADYSLTVGSPPVSTNTSNPTPISNQSNGTTIAPLASSDATDGGTTAGYTVNTLPTVAQGVLTLADGSVVSAGQVLTPTQAATLKFSPTPGYTGPASFTFSATDNDGFTDTTPATYTLSVVRPSLDLAIAKTASPKPAIAGQGLTYTITLTNNGPGSLVTSDALTLTDNLPAGFIATDYAASAGTYTSSTGNWTGLTLATGQSATITITGTVAASATGTLNNTATLALPAGITDSTPANNTATDATPITVKPVLVVVKTGQASVVAGNIIIYNIKVTNTGTANAVNASIADVVPASLTGVTWTSSVAGNATVVTGASGNGNTVGLTANIPAGAGNEINIEVKGTISAAASGSISNTATATPAETNGTAGSSTFIANITSNSGVTIAKTAPATLIAGADITYTVEVGNTGPSNAVGTNITDPISANITNVTWTATAMGTATVTSGATGTGNTLAVTGSIPAGSGNKITITVKGKVASSFSGTLNNTATATPAESGANPVSASASTNVSVLPVFTISKSAPSSTSAGSAIQYKINVKNTGLSNSTATPITDIIPSSILNATWVAVVKSGTASITLGASGSGNNVSVTANTTAGSEIEITVQGNVASNYSGTINNTAKVTPSEPGAKEQTSTATTTIQRKPTLTILKNGPTSIKAGQPITYTITVANNSTADAIDAVVTDVIPSTLINPSWTSVVTGNAAVTAGAAGNTANLNLKGNVPAGAGNSIVVTVTGTVPPSQTGTLNNTATVTPAEAGTTPVTTSPVTTAVSAEPNITLSKSGPVTAFAGQHITYQITAINNGPSDATNLAIKDIVPAVLTNVAWTASAIGSSTLSAGATGTGNTVNVTANLKTGNANKVSITIEGDIANNQNPTTISNTAVATPTEVGIAPVNSNTVNTTISNKTALKITKSGPATVSVGENVTYTMLVTNDGPSNAIGTSITDAIPAAMSDITWTAVATAPATITAGASGTVNALSVTANIPAESGSVLITVTGKLSPTFTGTSLTNTAQALVGAGPAVSSTTVATLVNRIADLNITKTGAQTLTAGENISYTLTVTNNGPASVTGAAIQDVVPAAIINTTWTATVQGTATVSATSGTGNAINLTGDLPAGAANKIVIVVNGKVNPTFAGTTITNTATATPPVGTTDPTPATATASAVVSRIADVVITKSAPANAGPGDAIEYVLHVTNEGLTTATNTRILDNLDAQLTGATWTINATNGATFVTPVSTNGNVDLTADIPKGGVIDITINGTISPGATAPGNVPNTATATVDPAITDVNTTNNTATAQTELRTNTDYTITKSGPSSIKNGENISYTITVENKGASPITGAIIKDDLPASLTQATWTANGVNGAAPSQASGSGNIDITGDLPSNGGKIIIVVVARVVATTDNSIENTATVQVLPDAPVSSAKTTAIIRSADLSVVKTGPATVIAGDNITYTITARNSGPEDVLKMNIQDQLPAQIQNASWSAVVSGAATLVTGTPTTGTGSINLPVNIPSGDANFITITVNGAIAANAAASTISNTASLDLNSSGGITDFNLANNTSVVSTTIISKPTLVVEKIGPLTESGGATINYTLKIRNTGLSDAIGINFSDVVSAAVNTVSWTSSVEGTAVVNNGATGTGNNVSLIGNIPTGNGAIIIKITGKISPSFVGTINNTASATIGTDPAVKSPTISTVIAPSAILTIVKNAPANIIAGQAITYTIQVNNEGPSNLVGSAITDNLPAELTNVSWTSTASAGAVITSGATGSGNALSMLANLPSDSQILINVTGTVPSNATASLQNTATITPAEPGIAPVVSPNAITTISRAPNLTFSKSAPANAGAGEAISYILTIQNTGPSDALNTAIADAVPTGLTGVTWTAIGTGGASVISGATGTGNTVAANVNVPVNGKVEVKINGTVNTTFAGTLTNSATITPAEAGVAPKTSTTITQVAAKVALTITKSAPTSLSAGQPISYQVRIKNNGPSKAGNVAITDNVPVSIENVSWSATGAGTAVVTGTASGTGSAVSLTADIPAGQANEIILTINGTVKSSFEGLITNNAQAVPSEAGSATATASATTTITRQSTLKIDKTGLAEVTPGSTITYQLKITNTGTGDAVNAAIADVVPAGISNVSWTSSVAGNATVVANGSGSGSTIALTANVPAGSTNIATVNISGTVDATTSGYLVNKASVTPTETGSVVANSPEVRTAVKPVGTDDALRTLAGTAKSIDVKTNDANATNYKVIAASNPTNGTLVYNTNGTITYTPNANYSGKDAFTYRLQSPDGILSDPINVAVTVYKASYTVSKVASATTVNVVGDVINYTLTVTNTGESVLSDIAITDAGADAGSISPATIATLAIGGSTTVTAKHTLVQADVDAASYSNQATASGTDENGNTITATSDDPNVVGDANATVKAINSPPSVTLSKTAPATANAGDEITYTLEVGNTGPTDASGISITDPVSANLTNVSWSAIATGTASITSGASGTGSSVAVVGNVAKGSANKITVTITGTIASSYSGTLSNTATATPTEVGTSAKTATASTVVKRVPTLTIQKSGPATIKAGQAITYTITVSNTSKADAIGAIVTDAIPSAILNPAWTSSVTGAATVTAGATGNTSALSLTGNIPVGSNNAIVIEVTGTVPASQTANLTNNATVTPAETGTSATTSSDVNTVVSAEPKIVINKTGPATVIAGQKVTYQIDVVNNGPSDAVSLPITDAVPTELTNVTWTATANGTSAISGSTTGTGNTVSVAANLKVGNANKVSIEIKGDISPTQAVASIANTAKATPAETGVEVSSNEVTTSITRKTGVTITKSGPATINAGEEITYTLLVKNDGPSTAIGSVITDAVDANLTNVSWTATPSGTATVTAGATGTNNALSVTGTIPPGNANNISITVKGKLASSFAGTTLANTAKVTPETGNAEISSNEVTTTVGKVADLRITKTAPQQATAGDNISYTVTVTNAGPSNVVGATIEDVVPTGIISTTWTAVASGAAVANTTTGTGNNISFTGDLTSAATDKIVVTVTGQIDPAFTGTSLANTATATPPTGTTDATPATATVTTAVGKSVDVSITKSGPANGGAGEAIAYSLRVTNYGLTTANNTHIIDDLSSLVAGATWTATSSSGATITSSAISGTGNIDIVATIPKGGFIDIAIEGTIPPSALVGSTLSNTASVTVDAGLTDQNTANNSATVDTEIKGNANYTVSKAGPSSVRVGDIITYTIIVKNTGVGNITGATIKDNLPAALTNASWTAVGSGGAVPSLANGTGNIDITGDLPVGDQIKLTVTATVVATTDNAIENIATVQVLPDDPISSAKTTTVIKTADVSIVKSGPSKVIAGDNITYTLVAKNNGPADVNNMVINDVLPTTLQNATWTATFAGTATLGTGGTVSGTGNVSLPVNIPHGTANSVTVTINAKVPSNAAAGNMDNTASLDLSGTGGINDVNLTDNSSTVSTTIVSEPLLVVEKIGQTTANAGGLIKYSIKVRNTGLSDAKDVSLTDLVPTSITTTSWTSSVEGTAVVNSGATGTGNNVNLTGDIPTGTNAILLDITGTIDPDFTGTINNTASAKIGAATPVQSPTVSTVVGKAASLTIVKNAPPTIIAGNEITYTIQVNNAGPSNLVGSSITDAIPGVLTNVSWSSAPSGGATITSGATGTGNNLAMVANLPANGQVLVTVTGLVPTSTTAAINNTATVTPAEPGILPVSSTVATTQVKSIPNFVFSKGAPASMAAGETIVYTLSLENFGPSNATNTAISDVVPSDVTVTNWIATASNGASIVSGNTGSNNTIASIVDVPVGGKVNVKITGTVNPAFTGNLLNNATVTPSEAGVAPINASATTIVAAKVTLAISKSAPVTLTAGQAISYQIKVKNNGPSNAINSVITDNVPADVIVSNWSATVLGTATINGANSGTTNGVTVNANIPNGATNEVVITVNGMVSPSYAGTITNTASVVPSEAGSASATASATTTVSRSPALTIDKTGPATATPGSTITYQLKVGNTGTSDALASVIKDAVPAGITNVSWSTTVAGTATIVANGTGSGNNVSITANVPAGAANTITVNITGTVAATTTGNLLNTATATPAEPGALQAISVQVQTAIKPVGTADVSRTLVGTPKTIDVKTNDANSSTYTVIKDSDPAHGSITVNADGTITYTPNTGTVGNDSFTYRLRSPEGILSDPITVTVTVYNASFTVEKVAGAANVSLAGDVINYTLTVTNTGQSILSNIAVTDAGADAGSITPANIATLAIGASATVTAKHTLTQTDVNSGSYSNQASAAGKDENGNNIAALSDDPNVTGTANPTVKLITPSPAIRLVKTGAVATDGNNINYQFTITNTGNVTLTAVTFTDAKLGINNEAVVLGTGLAPGANAVVNKTYVLTQADKDAGVVNNTASVAAKSPSGADVTDISGTDNNNDTPTQTNIATFPSISLVKIGVLNADKAHIDYTFKIRNTGNVTLNEVLLSDAMLGIAREIVVLPNGLAPGEEAIVNRSYTVTQSDKASGNVTNTAGVTAKTTFGTEITDVSGTAPDNDAPTVTDAGSLPVANNDSKVVTGNGPVNIDPIGNDSGDGIRVDPASITQPAHGKVVLNPDGTLTYTPDPGYTGPDSFSYSIIDGNGFISAPATVTLEVQAAVLAVPNLFTPNGDGRNDAFEIRGLEQYAQSELTIVNRWGNEVYHSRGSKYPNNWEGAGLSEGTYFYLLKVKKDTDSEWHVQKGYVTLMRNN